MSEDDATKPAAGPQRRPAAETTRGTTWAADDPFADGGNPYARLGPPAPFGPDSSGLGAERRIGQVRLIGVIGRGGMGKVYEGFDEALQRRVAVKTIHSGHRFSADAKARFQREARLLSKLDHPGICRIYNLAEEPDGDYLILELIDGESLGDAAISLSFEQKVRAAEGVTAALAAAHREQIVHRDLKPDNVMITAEGAVKVLDFGISRSLATPDRAARAGESAAAAAELTTAGSLIGTLRYMSPEQASGQRVGAATDLYSLGVMLQEMFTGRRAYADFAAPGELAAAVRRADTAPLDGVEPELAELIGELLRIEPEERPSADETLRRLRRRLERPQRQRRRRWLGAAAAAVVTAILAAAFAAHRAATPSPWLESGGRVLLLPFSNDTGDPELSWVEYGLASMVADSLSELDSVDLVPFTAVTRRLESEGLDSQSLEPGQITSLARAFRADLAIATRAERGDAEFALAYSAYRPAAAPSRAPREHLVRAEELADAAGQLGRRLAQRVAPGSAPAPPLSESFSDDPLLNRLYATGVQRLRRSGEAGCPYFRVCLDQDPSFLKAREMLAECLSQGSSEGAYDEAEGLWNEVVDQARKLGDRHLEAEASLDLGLLAVRRGRWAEAEDSLTAALEIFEDLGDAYYTTNALIAFSDLRSRRGGIEEAEGYLRRALEISEREQNDELTARSLHGLGVIASMRWRLDESLDLLQRALDLERSSVGLRHMEVNTLNSLGLVLPYLGRFEEAREALLEAQTLARRLGNARLEATITSSLGNVELHLDSLESAASYFAASVALFEQLENPAGAAYPSTNLAIALAKLGRHDEGRPHLELAIEHFLPDDVAVLYARGLYALADGDGAGAVELLEKAKGLSGPEGWSEEDEEILRDARRARRSP